MTSTRFFFFLTLFFKWDFHFSRHNLLFSRCEVSDVRDSVVQAMGHINHVALMDFLSEKIMLDYMKEMVDRKPEYKTRKRRRDALRLQLVKRGQSKSNLALALPFPLLMMEQLKIQARCASKLFLWCADFL